MSILTKGGEVEINKGVYLVQDTRSIATGDGWDI